MTQPRGKFNIGLIISSALTWFALLSLLASSEAAGGSGGPNSGSSSGAAESASSSQPLWSYQVKPSSYGQAANGQAHYNSMSSIFDAFNGLSQRQGALSGSPFLSILPIILIAAGGMLLLLPFLTMMVASPFGGGGNLYGGYNGGQYGYPQALGKKRSLLTDHLASKGFNEILEHVSSTIDELTRKYSPTTGQLKQRQAASESNKLRSGKSLNLAQTNEPSIQLQASAPPSQQQAGSNKPNIATANNRDETIDRLGSNATL